MPSTYDAFASHFSQTRSQPWPEFSVFVNALPASTKKILDVGCGNGRLRSYLPKEISYTGVDLSTELLSHAKKKFPEDLFFHMDMTKLSFEKNSFDAIFFIASFQHLRTKKERLETLEATFSLLRPGGKIFLSNWQLHHSPRRKKILHAIKNFLQSFGKESFYDYHIPWKSSSGEVLQTRYYHSFREKELQTLMKKNNFIVEKIFTTKEHASKKGNFNICLIAKKSEKKGNSLDPQ